MVEARGRRLSWWMGGIAAVGVLVTHWLTYRLALPDAEHRVDVLHHTGHVHLPVVSAIGLALFTVASLRIFILGAGGGRLPGFRSTAVRLAALQAAAWTALEVGERAIAGRLATLDDHALLVVGLGVQVAVALLGALLLRLASKVLAALAARSAPVRRRPPSVSLPAQSRRRHRVLPLTGAHALRGPPPLRPMS